MGMYWYTLRAETKTIDGIVIGRYSYAYKESWDNFPGSSSKTARLAETHAENAKYDNRDVRHFIMADSFATACQDGYYVFRIDYEPSGHVVEIPNATVVGYLRKERGRFVFKNIDR